MYIVGCFTAGRLNIVGLTLRQSLSEKLNCKNGLSEKAVASAMHIILRCYEFKRQLPVDSTDYATGIKEFIESKQIDLQEEIKWKAY